MAIKRVGRTFFRESNKHVGKNKHLHTCHFNLKHQKLLVGTIFFNHSTNNTYVHSMYLAFRFQGSTNVYIDPKLKEFFLKFNKRVAPNSACRQGKILRI